MIICEWGHSIILFLKSLVRGFFPVRLRNYREARVVFPGFDKNFVRERIRVAEKILNKKILIRRAKKNEPITTLDGQNFKLNNDHLVITDGKHPIALAGVMGL